MEKITMRIEADTVEQAREIYGRMTREGLRYVKGEYEVLLVAEGKGVKIKSRPQAVSSLGIRQGKIFHKRYKERRKKKMRNYSRPSAVDVTGTILIVTVILWGLAGIAKILLESC